MKLHNVISRNRFEIFFDILRWSSGGGLSDKTYRLKTRMETPKVIPDFATGARQLLAPRARSMERAERGLLAAVAQCIAEFPDRTNTSVDDFFLATHGLCPRRALLNFPVE